MNPNIKKLGIRIGLAGIIFMLIRLILSITLTKTKFYKNNLVIPQDFYPQFFSSNLLIISVAFTLVLFFIFNKDSIIEKKVSKLSKKQLALFLSLSFLFLFLHYSLKYFININLEFALQMPVLWGTLKYLFKILFTVFLFLAFIQKDYLKFLINKAKKQKWMIIIPLIVYFSMYFFQSLWPYFSKAVTKLVFLSLSLFYPKTYILSEFAEKGPILTSAGFTVQIGSPCSGIDSFLMFTALYIVIFALDYKKLKKRLYWLLFVPGIIGMFLFNSLRIFLLMLVGIHISPEFAQGLFHQNIGWIIFIIYFILFWFIVNKLIYKEHSDN